MSEAVNYLQVLSESLDKKIDILKQLEVLTAAQKEIVDKGEFDEEAFNDNVESKAALIDELEKLDTGFQILYDNIKNQIEGNKDRYKQEIAALQVKIKTITDIDQFFCFFLFRQFFKKCIGLFKSENFKIRFQPFQDFLFVFWGAAL